MFKGQVKKKQTPWMFSLYGTKWVGLLLKVTGKCKADHQGWLSRRGAAISSSWSFYTAWLYTHTEGFLCLFPPTPGGFIHDDQLHRCASAFYWMQRKQSPVLDLLRLKCCRIECQRKVSGELKDAEKINPEQFVSLSLLQRLGPICSYCALLPFW